jgi:hypothetical protein
MRYVHHIIPFNQEIKGNWVSSRENTFLPFSDTMKYWAKCITAGTSEVVSPTSEKSCSVTYPSFP